LKLQLKKLQRKNQEVDSEREILSPTNSNWQQFGYPEPKSDVTSLIEMKRKQTVVVPLRGGGGKNKISGTSVPRPVTPSRSKEYEPKAEAFINSLDLKKTCCSNGF